MAIEPIPPPPSSGNSDLDAHNRLVADELARIRAERTRASQAEAEINLVRSLTNTLGVEIPKGAMLGYNGTDLAFADSSVPVDALWVAKDLVGVNEEFVPGTSGEILEILVESGSDVTVGALAYTTKTTAQAGTATPTNPTTLADRRQMVGRWVGSTDAETKLARVYFVPQLFVMQV